jgi:hypothetical protein
MGIDSDLMGTGEFSIESGKLSQDQRSVVSEFAHFKHVGLHPQVKEDYFSTN